MKKPLHAEDGTVIGEYESFEVPHHNQCTAMVVWDDEFAVDQLERMMRAPHVFQAVRAFTNPCSEIPLFSGDLRPTKIFMNKTDWDDISKWGKES